MAKSDKVDHWVGFDLGGTKMLAIVYDADFRRVGRHRTKTLGFEGADAGVTRIVDTIRKALGEADIGHKRLGGIGIGCPGPLDLDQGIILEAPNLGWKDVPLKRALEKEFGCPTVISNDVDAGTYAEFRFGAGQGARCVLGVFPGTGIGGACVYEGEILRGQRSSCMEIGHVQVLPHGPRCGCGRRGCLEAVASRLAISAEATKAVYRGQAPHLRETGGMDISKIRSGALAKAIDAGDAVIERIVKEAAGYIGVALAGAVNLLAPDTVVLGGGLVEAMPKLFVGSVADAADRVVMPSFVGTYKIVAAELGDDASVSGAAAWAQHRTSGDRVRPGQGPARS
jgi:glucokinase